MSNENTISRRGLLMKIGMLFKIAELWADKKQKNDRAARAYEKALELEPQNLRAAEALIPIYSQAGNSKSLANAIEVKFSCDSCTPAGSSTSRRFVSAVESCSQDLPNCRSTPCLPTS